MNNLTNTILTKVTNLTQTSGAIANIADKLLNLILLEENAAAAPLPTICPTWPICGKCIDGYKRCRRCFKTILPSPCRCYNYRRAC
jgi:hypothetical protein